MKKNVLTILAVTGTFSVFYLLYKYKRRVVKKRNIEKPMETDADLNSVEKENILYKVYVNDSSVVRVNSGEENFYSDITNICKNSVTENINIEERNNIDDPIAALYSFDLIVNENLPTAESGGIHLTELNMPKILNCSKNSESFATYSCKDTQNSINNLLIQPDMTFLYPNGEDSSDITFLSPSIINTETFEELITKENCSEISKPQNGKFADINFFGSFNELNLEGLNSNVNIINGKISPTLHLDNIIEGKQYNTGKLNKKFDSTHENLSPLLDNVNDILIGASSVTSVTELNGESHLTNINVYSMVNGFENLNSTTAFSNFDTPKVLNEPNLSNNDVKQESSNGTKSKRKKHRRKKKNSNGNSNSSRSSSSESNENLPLSAKLNVDELKSNENSPPSATLNVDDMERNLNLPPSAKLNVDEMLSKNEIDNKCFTNSSSNPCDTVNLNKNEDESVCEKACSISEVATIGDKIFSISEVVTVEEEAFLISKVASVDEDFLVSEVATIEEEAFLISESAICEETVACMGTTAIDNYHIVCETEKSSLFPLVPVSEPHNLAEEPQCLPEMNGFKANHNFQNEVSVVYGYDFLVPNAYVGRIIGKNGSYVQKVTEEANVKMQVIKNVDDNTVGICELRGYTADEITAGLKMLRDRLPSEVTMENIFYGSGFNMSSFCPSNSIVENVMTIPIGVTFDLSVSSVESVGGIWIQQPSSTFYQRFAQMTVDMNHCYGDGSKIPKLQCPILKNTLAVCKLNDDWYRCLVDRIEEDTACVKLLDIGGHVRYPLKHLRHPTNNFQYIPFQATLVYLWGLEPPSGSKSYPEEGEKKLIELVQQQLLIGAVRAVSHPHRYHLIKLYKAYKDQYLYINRYLVQLGYARWADYVPANEM